MSPQTTAVGVTHSSKYLTGETALRFQCAFVSVIAICDFPFAICYMLCALCCLLFAICYLLFASQVELFEICTVCVRLMHGSCFVLLLTSSVQMENRCLKREMAKPS